MKDEYKKVQIPFGFNTDKSQETYLQRVVLWLFHSFFVAMTGHGKTLGMKSLLLRFHEQHPDWKILIIDSKDKRDYQDLNSDIPICFVETTEPLDLKALLEPIVSCYDEVTEILTEDGWKNHYELKGSDKFCTLNPESSEIEYQESEAIICYGYCGQMYHARSKQVDQLVTPNHRLFVAKRHGLISEKIKRFGFHRPAEIFGKHIFYKKDGVWNCSQKTVFELPSVERSPSHYRSSGSYPLNRSIPIANWLKIFGFWLAEGSATKLKIWHPIKKYYYCGYDVSFANEDKELRSEIESLLRESGFKTHDSGHAIHVRSKQLWSYLAQFGKAWEKWIPTEIKQLPADHLKILLEYYGKGDGHFQNGRLRSCKTTSARLRDDIQEIALKVGISASYCPKPEMSNGIIHGRKIIAIHPCWVISFNYEQNTPRFYSARAKHDGTHLIEQWESYNGKVWCVTVPNGIVYVRRNGKPVWSGNSNLMYYFDKIIEEAVFDTLGEIQRSIAQKIEDADAHRTRISGKDLGKLRVLNYTMRKLVVLVEKPNITKELKLHDGFNVMAISLPDVKNPTLKRAFQQLIVRSVLVLLLADQSLEKTLLVLDESHKWSSQKYGSICKQPLSEYVSEGRSQDKFVWLSDQALTKVDKEPLKNVKIWVVGQQMESNEVEDARDTVNSITDLNVKDSEIKTLKVGNFIIVDGLHGKVERAYLQPYNVPDGCAIKIAEGEDPELAESYIREFEATEKPAHFMRNIPDEPKSKSSMKQEDDEMVWKEKFDKLQKDLEELQGKYDELLDDFNSLKDGSKEMQKQFEFATKELSESEKRVATLRKELEQAKIFREAFRDFFSIPMMAEGKAVEGSVKINLEKQGIDINVHDISPKEVNLTTEKPSGQLMACAVDLTRKALVAKKEPVFTSADLSHEAAENGWQIANISLGMALKSMVRDGWLIQEGDGYRLPLLVKVNVTKKT